MARSVLPLKSRAARPGLQSHPPTLCTRYCYAQSSPPLAAAAAALRKRRRAGAGADADADADAAGADDDPDDDEDDEEEEEDDDDDEEPSSPSPAARAFLPGARAAPSARGRLRPAAAAAPRSDFTA